MPLTRKLQQVAEEMALVGDAQERLALLVDRAKKAPPLPSELRTAAHRVPGCVSVVWLVGDMREGRCYFRSDAESPLVRALVWFLAEFYSGFTPAEIVGAEADPLEALGLSRDLSPTRRHGLASARDAIQGFAKACA